MTAMTLLPASNTRIPASDYVITGLKTMMGREGEAFSGKLRKGKRIVADILQDGNGGETRLYFVTREDDAEFTEFVKLWEGMIWGVTDFSPEGFPFRTDEDVVNLLAYDMMLLKELKRASKTKLLFLKDGESPRDLYNIVTKLTFEHSDLKAILAKQFPEVVLYWNNEGWVAP
jgi:hypothetical protein